MQKFIVLTLLCTSIVNAIPIDNETYFEPDIESVNMFLYGNSNPEWLKYVNDDGVFDPSLVDPEHPVEFNVSEQFYNAASSTKFFLYTKKEPIRRQIILEDLESIKASSFNPKNSIRFLIHGWQDNERSKMIQTIKDAYMETADFNIIVVDWGKGASSLNYYASRHRIGNVAEVVKRFIDFLVLNLKVNTKQMQLVGHSLGAHIAGLTGKALEVGRIPVIVGLDPALPLFSIKKPKDRLDVSDADYVEVIHTAGGSLGFDDPIGKADFYPNYGRSQPGCGLDLTGACAHSRAYAFFAESIFTGVGFWSDQCGEYNEIKKKKCAQTGIIVTLGGDPLVITRAIGNYHLQTNKQSPFAKGLLK